MKEENKKLIASIWVDALRYSAKYKDLCEWKRKQKEDPTLTISQEFQELYTPGHDNTLIYLYYKYEDVCVDDFDFDKWWKLYKNIVPLTLDFQDFSPLPKPVTNYADFIERDIESCMNAFKLTEGREPTLQEFVNFFSTIIKTSLHPMHLVIDPFEDTEKLIESFRRFISPRHGLKKDSSIKEGELLRRRYYRPVKWKDVESMRRCLDVYIQSQKYSYQKKRKRIIAYDIAREVKGYKEKIEKVKDEKMDYDSIKREVDRDLENAEKLIKNVEKGFLIM